VLLNGLHLDLEITENVLQAVEQHQEMLSRVKSLGIMLAIDDFGTGYSSLGRIKDLPIDTIKIDRSFVHDIPHHADDMAIASAIVAMAHSLSLKVVAEGIENSDQLSFFRSIHCEEGQGYLFSRPVTAEAIHDMLANGTRFAP
jgi:EAL domain-containing protein (putative c-di-GMP-specific phosphodiesterase class I)